MKKQTRNIALSLLTASLLLTGCGSSSVMSYSKDSTSASTYEEYEMCEEAPLSNETDYADYAGDEEIASEADTGSGSAALDPDATSNTSTNTSDQKMIITWSLSLETDHYEDLLTSLRRDIKNANGYIENENESVWGDDYHYCSLIVRIPSDQTDSWITGIEPYATITSRSQSQTNATLTYIDLESRIDSLRAEQEALQNLMSQAGSVEDLITVQSRLSDVSYEIESYESQLRSLANTVSYSTIYLDIQEVSREVSVTPGFGEEVAEKFHASIDWLTALLRNLLVGILGYSVIIILVALLIFLLVRKIRKSSAKSRQKRAARTAASMAASQVPQGPQTPCRPPQAPMVKDTPNESSPQR